MLGIYQNILTMHGPLGVKFILGLPERTKYPYNVTTQETVTQVTPAVKANIHVYQNKHFFLPHVITSLSTYSFTATCISLFI